MWQNLAAGVFSVPTTTLPNYTIGQRLTLLEDAITALEQFRNTRMATAPSPRWNNAGTRPSMVLVAPPEAYSDATQIHGFTLKLGVIELDL
jgi:hypothetical protein